PLAGPASGDRPERGADGHPFLHPDVAAITRPDEGNEGSRFQARARLPKPAAFFSVLPFFYCGNYFNKKKSLKKKPIRFAPSYENEKAKKMKPFGWKLHKNDRYRQSGFHSIYRLES
ncbi:MAG TPA: hypothetical protein PKI53_12060, partial [Candidatus Aminicenantes bacterium]|nr:hypothetical protein [Candidatus Aminicenantes bacterium]